jgi:hypothetical protein
MPIKASKTKTQEFVIPAAFDFIAQEVLTQASPVEGDLARRDIDRQGRDMLALQLTIETDKMCFIYQSRPV